MRTPLTPLAFRQRAASLFGRKVAIVDGDQRFSYAQFSARVDRLANALRARGLARGERVATLAFNSAPLLEAYFGVPTAGGILLPLNVRLGPADIARIIDHAKPRLLLADPTLGPLLREALVAAQAAPQIIWLGAERRGADAYEEMLAQASSAPPPPLDIDEDEVAELFYTSGTTGAPRGVMLTHRNLYLHALSFLITFRAAESDVQLHTIPLFHVNGWGTPQAITAVGGTHVMLRSFDPSEALRLIEAERVNRFFAVPTMLAMILDHPDLGRRDLSSLELVNTGGAPTPPDLLRRAERALGCQVIGGYGLTETSPIITFAAAKSYLGDSDDDLQLRRRASTGLPMVGTEIAIVDAHGAPLAWDGEAVGEIVVRGNVVCAGYWDDQAATAEAFRDGWFHTGDLATIDPEGYVLIVDRKKDIIVSGGENISSIEVERALYTHPAVLECAVIPVPDPRWGEAVKAVVATRPGQEVSAEALIRHCRAQLASFKVPKSVDFCDSLPKGGTGKILKRELRRRYSQGSYL